MFMIVSGMYSSAVDMCEGKPHSSEIGQTQLTEEPTDCGYGNIKYFLINFIVYSDLLCFVVLLKSFKNLHWQRIYIVHKPAFVRIFLSYGTNSSRNARIRVADRLKYRKKDDIHYFYQQFRFIHLCRFLQNI